MSGIYLCKSNTSDINLYRAIYYMHIECYRMHKFIERPGLMNSHEFVMHIKMTLYGSTQIMHLEQGPWKGLAE